MKRERIAVIVGNPRPRSRTLDLATRMAEQISARRSDLDYKLYDLAEHGTDMFASACPVLDAWHAEVLDSSIAIVASPTYKGQCTGLLKSFLDRFAAGSLRGVRAIPMMTGGSPAHSLATEYSLRPVLAELGASLPTPSLYIDMNGPLRPIDAVDGWTASFSSMVLS